MFLTDAGLIYKGIRPLQKLGTTLALSNPLAGMSMPQRVPDSLRVVPPDPWAGDPQLGRDMITGIFRFSGQTIEKESLSWNPEGARPEWVAELHGFEWVRDLRSVGGERARRMAREMVSSWLDRYQKPCPIAWQPDVTGVRLSSWISFHDFFCASADEEFRKSYFTSILRQARYLAKALPGGLTGIPMMRAIKGLAYSGIALEEGEERVGQAFSLIKRQIRDQLLPDGGHISRSPQATFEFLQCLVDMRTSLTAARLEMPEEIQHAIDRLAPAVKFFRHGDGALCQFNGAQEGNSNICDATLMHSGSRGKAMRSLPHTGYEKIQLGRSALIMDTGLPNGSAYSDRAHAGLLSFEYSFGKDRVIVNCGTAAVKGKWRDLLRSTAAHSTIVIDNRSSLNFDQHGVVSGLPDVRSKKHEDGDIAVIEASHGGYLPRHGLTHRRSVKLMDGGETLSGEEQLQGKSGVPYAARFHLHPGIQASIINDGTEVLLRARSGTGWRFSVSAGMLSVEDSIYAGEGESPRRTSQIVISGVTESAMTAIEWELRREKI